MGGPAEPAGLGPLILPAPGAPVVPAAAEVRLPRSGVSALQDTSSALAATITQPKRRLRVDSCIVIRFARRDRRASAPAGRSVLPAKIRVAASRTHEQSVRYPNPPAPSPASAPLDTSVGCRTTFQIGSQGYETRIGRGRPARCRLQRQRSSRHPPRCATHRPRSSAARPTLPPNTPPQRT